MVTNAIGRHRRSGEPLAVGGVFRQYAGQTIVDTVHDLSAEPVQILHLLAVVVQ